MSRLLITASAVLGLTSACAGTDGADGASYLTDIGPEPAGANCAAGGVRVAAGPDDNGNGTLDAAEVSQSSFVCAQPASTTAVTAEPPGTNCPAGGARIDSGPDTNGDGTLATGEITATSYVCGAGTAQIVQVYEDSYVDSPLNTSVTAQTAAITTTAPGKVLAFASVDVYCNATECPTPSGQTPPAIGTIWLSLSNTEDSPTAPEPYEYFYLDQNRTESMTRATSFDVPAAGTYTYYLRSRCSFARYGLYRPQITLVYLPGATSPTPPPPPV